LLLGIECHLRLSRLSLFGEEGLASGGKDVKKVFWSAAGVACPHHGAKDVFVSGDSIGLAVKSFVS
jgi:hypothetical protein